MSARIRIAIDAMGGDFGLRVSLPAAVKSLSLFPDLDIVLVGDEQSITAALDLPPECSARVKIIHADDVVTMSDKPSFALRKKPQSSMRQAINLLQREDVDAVVSAGNTGALMAMGCYVLKTLPGIDRPAICSALPTATGHCYLLDLGANVDSCAEHLHQFAIMGSAMAATLDACDSPRVALLNIGQEEIKGNEQVKLASRLIEADKQLNYVGFIEGDGVFRGEADVVVCDGFVGNVALKICEGTASHIGGLVSQAFSKNLFTRIAGLIALPVLKSIYKKVDPQYYNGASFLGLQGVVVKSHGNSSVESFQYAIAQARSEVEQNMLGLIDQRLANLV